MPIFFEQEINANTKIAIWKIEEEESFFLNSIMPQRHVTHPHKKLQHLAGRYLLKHLFPHFPVELIQIADTRKPFLQDEAYHFSISHCGNFAAAIVSNTNRVGVDIEIPTPKVERIKHKFLSQEEIRDVNKQLTIRKTQLATSSWPDAFESDKEMISIEQLTLLWSCKEAVYKWAGVGEIDFKGHMPLKKIKQISEDTCLAEICFQKKEVTPLTLHCRLFDGLVLSYVVT